MSRGDSASASQRPVARLRLGQILAWQGRTRVLRPQLRRHWHVFVEAVATDAESAVPRALHVHRGRAVVQVWTPAVVDDTTPGGLDDFP